MSETITVREVNKRGQWFDITLEDERVVATRNNKLAEAANASRGSEVEAVINTVQKGQFTNHYLNEIAGVKDDRAPANGTKPAAKAAPRSGGKSDEVQERIARQWAYGRSVELLMASGEDFAFPLDEVTLQGLEKTAKMLLDKTR